MPSTFINTTRRAPAPGGAAGPINLSMSMQPQQQSEWCWAAVSASTSVFYNAASTWTQCQLANQQLNQTTCCANGGTPACNQPWYLDRALTATGNLNQWLSGTMVMAALQTQLSGGHIVGARIQWSGGGGHFVALDGCDAAAQTLSVKDPIYGASTYNYAAFNGQYQGNGSWTDSYLTQ